MTNIFGNLLRDTGAGIYAYMCFMIKGAWPNSFFSFFLLGVGGTPKVAQGLLLSPLGKSLLAMLGELYVVLRIGIRSTLCKCPAYCIISSFKHSIFRERR